MFVGIDSKHLSKVDINMATPFESLKSVISLVGLVICKIQTPPLVKDV